MLRALSDSLLLYSITNLIRHFPSQCFHPQTELFGFSVRVNFLVAFYTISFPAYKACLHVTYISPHQLVRLVSVILFLLGAVLLPGDAGQQDYRGGILG